MIRSLGTALIAVALITAPVMAAPTGNMAPLGVVLQADHAGIGAGPASNGATVYDGDTLATYDGGALRVRPSELLLPARKGSLEVSMDDDVKTVPEGTSVRMLIRTAEAAAAPAAT